MNLELDMEYRELRLYKVCINKKCIQDTSFIVDTALLIYHIYNKEQQRDEQDEQVENSEESSKPDIYPAHNNRQYFKNLSWSSTNLILSLVSMNNVK